MKQKICDACGCKIEESPVDWEISDMSFNITNDSGGSENVYEDLCKTCTRKILNILHGQKNV